MKPLVFFTAEQDKTFSCIVILNSWYITLLTRLFKKLTDIFNELSFINWNVSTDVDFTIKKSVKNLFSLRMWKENYNTVIFTKTFHRNNYTKTPNYLSFNRGKQLVKMRNKTKLIFHPKNIFYITAVTGDKL